MREMSEFGSGDELKRVRREKAVIVSREGSGV